MNEISPTEKPSGAPGPASSPAAKTPPATKPAEPKPVTKATPLERLVGSRHLISRPDIQLLHRRKFRLTRIFFVLAVILPTTLSAIYYTFFASDMYESASELSVRDVRGGGGMLDSFISKTFGSATSQDSRVAQHYILSHDIVRKLETMVNLRAMYDGKEHDFFARLAPDASPEELNDYYRKIVEAEFDSDSAITTLKVRAFTPEDAQTLSRAIIDLTDELVFNMAERARADALNQANDELAKAEERLLNITTRMAAFQQSEQDLSPEATARAHGGIIAKLEEELVTTRAKLAELRSYMQPDTARVRTVRARVTALETQLNHERQRISGVGPTDQGMIDKLFGYERLKLEQTLSRRAYEMALSTHEAARIEANRRSIYLVPFVEPNLPQEATHPKRFVSVLTIFFGSLVVFGISALVVSAIKEHAEL